MDFITVCYINDLPQMKIQARSLDKFLKKFPIGRIIVIVNGYFEICQSYFEQEIRACYGSLADRVELIDGNQLLPNLILSESYFNQMRLKIMIANQLTSEYVCILDSKNFLSCEWEITDLIDDQGRMRATFDDAAHPDWQQASEESFKLFGLDESKHIKLAPHTPFLVQTDILKTVANVPNLIFTWKTKPLVEFLMVTAAIFERDGTLDKTYWSDRHRWTISVWPGELGTYDVLDVDGIVKTLLNDEVKVLSLGLHRKCFLLARPHIIHSFKVIWERLGLATFEESDKIIDQMKRYNFAFVGKRLK